MITKNTGWKNPKVIKQYNKYNGKVGSSWSRLDTVKLDEPKSKTEPYDLSAVCYKLTKTQYSALMYIYDFGFNIPSKANITKILIKLIKCGDDITTSHVQTTLLKLKTGASVTDQGVGNNIAPFKAWRSHRDANRMGMDETTHGNSTGTIKNVYGVNITPAMVNSNNFGCVFQCGADGTLGHKAYVDSIQMYVEYTIPDDTPIVTPTKTVEESRHDVSAEISLVKYNTLSPTQIIAQTTISQSYDNPGGYHFWIKFTNAAYEKNGTKVITSQYSPTYILESDEKLMFSGGTHSLTIPSQLIKGTSDSQYFKSSTFPLAPDCIEQFFDVYAFSTVTDFNKYVTPPDTYIESTVSLYTTKIVNGKTVKKDLVNSVTFKLNNSNSNISNSQTIIEDCTFVNNKANKAAAIYNLGRLYLKNITFTNNTTHGTGKNNCQFFDIDICRDGEF